MAHRRAFPRDAGPKATLQCRTTEALFERVAERAAINKRSMSCETEHLIERALATEDVAAAVREEFARYRAETSVMPNMRDEDRAEWLRH